jgi:hypothetical protein
MERHRQAIRGRVWQKHVTSGFTNGAKARERQSAHVDRHRCQSPRIRIRILRDPQIFHHCREDARVRRRGELVAETVPEEMGRDRSSDPGRRRDSNPTANTRQASTSSACSRALDAAGLRHLGILQSQPSLGLEHYISKPLRKHPSQLGRVQRLPVVSHGLPSLDSPLGRTQAARPKIDLMTTKTRDELQT